MALRAVPEHPKFGRLKRTLEVHKSAVLGLLEGLWHFTGKFTAPRDFWSPPEAEIEPWLQWSGESGPLASVLPTRVCVDDDKDLRLIVSDWHKHADDATKLAALKAEFCRDGDATECRQWRRSADATTKAKFRASIRARADLEFSRQKGAQ